MDTIKINKGTTKLIAHRGVSALEQENTVASFLLASYKTYFGIETDVHVTKDNKFIICHDDNIKRVTGINKIIEDSTYDELKRIRVFDKDGSYKNNLSLPSFTKLVSVPLRVSASVFFALDFFNCFFKSKNILTKRN